MSQYFAQINDDNVVTRVAVVSREFLEANPERYAGKWIETFIDVEGKVYAGIGYKYDEVADNFIAPLFVFEPPLPPYTT